MTWAEEGGMEKGKFKVGDRVSVYGNTAGGWADGLWAEVVDCLARDLIRVKFDCDEWDPRLQDVHPKQCRRLKKRARRRVWISNASLKMIAERGEADVKISVGSSPCIGDDVEFVEVPRRKKP